MFEIIESSDERRYYQDFNLCSKLLIPIPKLQFPNVQESVKMMKDQSHDTLESTGLKTGL